MLRQLAVYHAKDPNNLFCVRIAQGLTHLGKGTLTLCPYHSDRQLLSNVSVAGLMAFLVSCLDVKNSKLSRDIFRISSLSRHGHTELMVRQYSIIILKNVQKYLVLKILAVILSVVFFSFCSYSWKISLRIVSLGVGYAATYVSHIR